VPPSDVDLEALARRVPARSLTRFAPAPTGWLHLGHVLNARYVWAIAQAIGGRVLLRIEDHDRERCRPEFETGILDDLDWLGFAPDVFATTDFRAGRCEGRQSDREPDYLEAVQILCARGLVYGCDCSRKHILESSDSGSDEELVYPGTCRTRSLPLNDDVGWRVCLDTDHSGPEVFDDVMLGVQSQDPMAQCGDLLIRDRRGNWTYQFAVTVDDWLQGIDLVIRGRDLLASTGRQIRLARMLGRERPAVFLHHPLIMKSADQKLSKSDRDTGVRDLRAAGWSAGQVLDESARGV
jgi:glutamyl-tRNA synthetase/glutamyl-Q tRNA(Asp) synthetase